MVKEGVLADNTILSNFALIEREDVLRKLFKNKFYTTGEVLKELRNGEDRGVLPKVDWQWVEVLKFETHQEEFLFRLFSDSLGRGESSCLGIASIRNLKMLTDDLDARKLAQRKGIPVSGTIGVLVAAVRSGIISPDEGNAMLSKMIDNGYYSPFENLDELL
jgi:predicted nucleic acid-binding protein